MITHSSWWTTKKRIKVTIELRQIICSTEIYICGSNMMWNDHYLHVSHCLLYSIPLVILYVCVHKCVLEWATAADGAKRYRLQLHLLWLPYELKKGLKKKIIDAQLPCEYYYTAVTRHFSHPSCVRGVSNIVRIIVYGSNVIIDTYTNSKKQCVTRWKWD